MKHFTDVSLDTGGLSLEGDFCVGGFLVLDGWEVAAEEATSLTSSDRLTGALQPDFAPPELDEADVVEELWK